MVAAGRHSNRIIAMNKRLPYLLTGILIIGSLSLIEIGCDEDTSDPIGSRPNYNLIALLLGDESLELDLRDFTSTTFSGLNVVSLDCLISREVHDSIVDNQATAPDLRTLFAFRMHGSDDFTPYDVIGEDLVWEVFRQGYIALGTRNMIFPDTLELARTYSVRDCDRIELFRKMNVITPSSSGFVILDELESEQKSIGLGGPLEVIPLYSFIPLRIATTTPDSFGYRIIGINGSTQDTSLTWQEWMKGYWIIELNVTWFDTVTLQQPEYQVYHAQSILIE